jgi:FtsH-binding integral membrane protein
MNMMMDWPLRPVALRKTFCDNTMLEVAGPLGAACCHGLIRSLPMSYAYDVGIAANAPALERAAFIRRTYGHLAAAVLAFIGIEFTLLHLPGIDGIVRGMLGVSWLLILGAFMVVSWLAHYWARSGASPAMQYAGLGLYILAESIIFLPLLYIADNAFPGRNIIPTAGILTLTVFGGLTATVFITRKDFSWMGPILCIASFIALGLIVASVLFGFSLGLVFCFAMVAVLSGCILYYTSNVLHHYRTDMHVAAALALFSSIATLFWYILQIVMASRD